MSDPLLWHRLQFAFTIVFHYLFPQLTMGLALLIVVMKAIGLRTGDERWNDAARFWIRIFGVNFAVGVASRPLDFVQINYSVGEREAEQRLLPLAQERGAAVIANRPFAGGDLFRPCAAGGCPRGRPRSIATAGRSSFSSSSSRIRRSPARSPPRRAWPTCATT